MSHTRISTTTQSSWLIVASMILAIFAFGYRFVSLSGFSNDHFVHLARAQAMLAGDLPIRGNGQTSEVTIPRLADYELIVLQ